MKKVLSVILALCMLVMLLPTAALGAIFDSFRADIYVSQWDTTGEEPVPLHYTFNYSEADGSVSDDPVAVYVYGGAPYKIDEDLSGIFLFVNASYVLFEDVGRISGENVFTCGGGHVEYNGLLIHSAAGAPPQNATADQLVAFATELLETVPLELSGEINEIFTFDNVLIKAGEDHALVIKTAPEDADPNGLNIVSSLTVEEGASLTGEPGQILQIGRGATVSGLTLYDSDGETVWTDNSHDETFNYDAESGKWIRSFVPGPEPPPVERSFRAFFTPELGTVKAGETGLSDGVEYPFEFEETGTPITFTLTPNDPSNAPFVMLEVFDGSAPEDETFIPNTVYDSLLEENIPEERRYTLALTEGENGERSFTFTPASTAYFELSVFWGEKDRFDRFNCGDDEKIVEYRIIGNGDVSFGDAELGGWCCYHNDEDGFTYYKQAVRRTVTSLTVTITPRDGCELDTLGLAGTPLDESAYTVADGVATYTWTELDKGLDVIFTGSGGPEPPAPSDEKTYRVFYTDSLGTVKADGEALESGKAYDFVFEGETGTPIAFSIAPNDAAAEPFVELEVFDGSAPGIEPFVPNTVYDSRMEADEPENNRYKLVMAESGGVYAFTFAPTGTSYFELRVYWSDEDWFDSFVFGEDEIAVEYHVYGDGDVCFDDEHGSPGYYTGEYMRFKHPVSKTAGSVAVTIVPRGNSSLDALRVGGESVEFSAAEDGSVVYEWTGLDSVLEAVFVETGEPGPAYDFERAKQQVESRDYAYCGTAEEIKGYFAQELWAEIFGELLHWNGEAYESAHAGEFSGMFGAAEAPEYAGDDLVCAVTGSFLDAITLGEEQAASEENVLALPYYEYSLALPDGETVAQGRIYKLEKATQFVVRAGESYTVVDTADYGEGEDIVIRAAGGDDFDADVFGNGVCVAGGLDAGEGVLWAAHVTQEHSGLDIGNINARLLIVPNDFLGVRIDGEAWAAPWGFASVALYPVGTQDEPADAVVYYGNDGTEGRVLKLYKDSGVAGNKTVALVEIDETRLSLAAATIIETNDGYFTFEFHTSYGLIPLIVTFDDGSKGYLDLYRTGLDIQYHEVEDGKIFIRHGLEGTEYGSDAERAVTGSFYYATGETQPDGSVTLFVTVTTADGVERREVSRLNDSFIETEGSDKWCDDFLLWSGTEAEWAEVVSVEAEAASSGPASGGEVTGLTGEASASSVTFEGTASEYISAVSVQLLDGDEVLATDGFPVVDGEFSGSFEGLALETGKTYMLRAADYDGGEWFSVEVEVPGGSTPPSPPTPPTPPSPGGGGSTVTKKYTLTFDSNGGSEIAPVEDKDGAVVDLSGYVPTKSGYEFVGWCGSPSLGDVLKKVALTQDITVYAKWRIACDHGESCPLSAFTDLDPNAWYHEGVHFCLTRGIMNGIGGGLFDPAGTATRAQIVTMLYRLEGEPAVAGDNPFTDVPADSFYYKSTAWASAEGIVNGYGDGIFGPDDLITREQAATILYRYAKYKGVDTDALSANTNTLSYTDVFMISDFARPAMHFCIAIHVLNGYDGYLRPQDTAARAEVAAMFQRLCDVIF